MISHVILGANDLAASKGFYDATLGALGQKPGHEIPGAGRVMYMSATGVFGITTPIDGQPACHANGGTIGFAASSPEQVDAFHAAGVENGGVSIENPPGLRQGAFGNLYLAYLRDPSGNKVCAMYRAE